MTSSPIDLPEVKVSIETTEHPDAVRIEIVLLRADADARALVEKAIMVAVNGVLESDEETISAKRIH